MEEDIVPRGDLNKIKATPKERAVVLDAVSNIRQYLGYKSESNQGKLRAAYEERERQIAEEAEKKAEETRKEEEKIAFYSDFNGLRQKWKIYDQEKLKVRELHRAEINSFFLFRKPLEMK